MDTGLPIISAAGVFHSRDKFSDAGKYPQGVMTPLRTVVEYELELFLEDGGVSHLNGKSYPIHKGDILLAQPGDRRQSTLHFSALFLHFDAADPAIRQLLGAVSGFHAGGNLEKWEPLLREICREALRFDFDGDMAAASNLLQLLCLLNKESVDRVAASVPGNRSVISTAIIYMRENCSQNLTVNDIAWHCGVSASYFYKLFLDTVHTTPNRYFLSLKLSAAKNLLATEALSVSEVADRCGFQSPSYFSYCFQKAFGISPRKFRNAFAYTTAD